MHVSFHAKIVFDSALYSKFGVGFQLKPTLRPASAACGLVAVAFMAAACVAPSGLLLTCCLVDRQLAGWPEAGCLLRPTA